MERRSRCPTGPPSLTLLMRQDRRVPTLCQDNKLHPFGACRICLVEVEGTPRKFTPSCTTPATDNMVVRTTSPALIEARRMVLELLLIKHPLDCPVCDKAGECQLQDLVHEYGLAPSRFDAEKGYLPPDLESPIVERNISRCILCGKCVRICDEQNGVGEWAFTRRGTRARISTDFDRPLDCEFCGECTEICPVGALTTRQFKYKARSWNLEGTKSVCNYCGCGCGITYETRDGKIMRVGPAQDNYLCAKGRFGWDAVHSSERITTPKMRIGGELVDCNWDEALSVIATTLKVIKSKRGPQSIGALGSVRTTNEDSYLFQKFMRTVVGTNNVDMLARLKVPKGLNAAFFSGELNKMSEHDVILILDKNVGEINPLTGIEIVRAVTRKERKVILVNSEQNKFNKIASVVIPTSSEKAIEGLVSALSSAKGGSEVLKAAELLKAAKSVAIIVPARVTDKEFVMIKELSGQLKNVTHYPLVRRSNFQGALDMGMHPAYYPGYSAVDIDQTALFASAWNAILSETPGMNAVEMIEAIAPGKLAALYIMGDDPVGSDRASSTARQARVPGCAGHLHDRDGDDRRRGAPGGGECGEDRYVHQPGTQAAAAEQGGRSHRRVTAGLGNHSGYSKADGRPDALCLGPGHHERDQGGCADVRRPRDRRMLAAREVPADQYGHRSLACFGLDHDAGSANGREAAFLIRRDDNAFP